MREVEQYRIFEVEVEAGQQGKDIVAVFTNGEDKKQVSGFWKDKGLYAIRFMPQTPGKWQYEIHGGKEAEQGEFLCVPAREENHGMVTAAGFGFCYSDRSRFLPFGTTCYAWVHQGRDTIEQTLETLKNAPFNKVRMCVFPKDMIYNQNEPECFPFRRTENGTWDVSDPDPEFWKHLEDCIIQLDMLGIEADLILFHPYDRWGFSTMSREDCLAYLEYCVSRLSAFKNIWWSLANEYDLMEKEEADWEVFAEAISKNDIYHHLMSIHHCLGMYPKREWMTHCSVQTQAPQKSLALRYQYGIPVVIDECGYEGDIEFAWGNLSPFEMVHRIWTAVARGGYATHGETYFKENEVLWWAKGGRLYGESTERIRFLKNILEECDGEMEPVVELGSSDPNGREQEQDNPFAKALMRLPEEERNEYVMGLIPQVIGNGRYRLQYLGRTCPAWLDLELKEGEYRIEVIDIWEMTRRTAYEKASGRVRVPLPAKEGMAVFSERI